MTISIDGLTYNIKTGVERRLVLPTYLAVTRGKTVSEYDRFATKYLGRDNRLSVEEIRQTIEARKPKKP